LEKKGKSINFHSQVLRSTQATVLKQIGPLPLHSRFYLGGGTAIALYFGHRRSVDFDWFTGSRITDPLRLAQDIRDGGIAFVTGQVERGTLYGTISGVRISFLEYRYPLLKPSVLWPKFKCQIASLEDLACMKLSAIAQRGSRKDFIDLYALGLKHLSLREMLQLYQRKYSVQDIAHVLFGLAYFDDAEAERMPRMIWNVDWTTVKRTIEKWIKEVAG
jgi:hypothetical protein